MKKFIIFVLLLMIDFEAISQPLKLVKSKFEAKWTVHFTTNQKEANVIGYKVKNYWECIKPGYIYLAPVYFKSATPVFEVKNKSQADLVIYWTQDKSKAKWIK